MRNVDYVVKIIKDDILVDQIIWNSEITSGEITLMVEIVIPGIKVVIFTLEMVIIDNIDFNIIALMLGVNVVWILLDQDGIIVIGREHVVVCENNLEIRQLLQGDRVRTRI